ncbi:hypothetical protein ACMXYV_10275 [Neptuniibacter sp. SY11_33]|uniref:hypothetical protein n=1 Tax=Neptuniibacter sp. SY11_33 TaxID=3398215 RepID=UPI0039F56E0B
MDNQKRYFKNDYKQDVFFIFLIVVLELIFYPIAVKGDILAIVLSVVLFTAMLVFIFGLIPKRIWVSVGEEGVSYHNLFRQYDVPWNTISHSFTFTLNFIKGVHIKCLDGRAHMMPVTGAQAKEISEHINNVLAERRPKK